MGESSLFMAGKLQRPETIKTSADNTSVPKVKSKKDKPEAEKPWVGTVALRDLNKRNEERNKAAQTEVLLPEVPLVPIVHSVPEVPRQIEVFPIAPIKDFHRVSNSINRMALEGGMFTRPSCKHVYDALYLLTRGAVQPSRTVQIGRKLLQKKAGIGSDKTLDAAIASLQQVKLLRVHVTFGNQKGNVYEVFLPEEISVGKSKLEISLTSDTNGTLGTIGTNSTVGYFSPNVPLVESTQGTDSQTVENKDTYSSANTSFKDNTKNDDDARVSETFLVMSKRLDDAVKKITGKGVSKIEAEKWGTLADLLILELEVAASRADGVSSVPAFLTEVLRRQFFASRQQQSSAVKHSKVKTDTVGKPDPGQYEIKPLDTKGREAALEQLSEFAADEFLHDFKKWYTSEDWTWLMNKLEISDQ
jgi:hypothetical protein